MKLSPLLAAISVTAILLVPTLAHAGEGHDHGDPAPVPTGPALPRFAASSELFELVGVLDGRRITLYLDRAADNAPVTDAQIELEIAGVRLEVDKHDDVFEAVLAVEPKPGVLPVTATVMASNDVDLLAGELDLHEEPLAADTAAVSWREYAGWAAAVALVVLWLIGRAAAAARQRRAGADA